MSSGEGHSHEACRDLHAQSGGCCPGLAAVGSEPFRVVPAALPWGRPGKVTLLRPEGGAVQIASPSHVGRTHRSLTPAAIGERCYALVRRMSVTGQRIANLVTI